MPHVFQSLEADACAIARHLHLERDCRRVLLWGESGTGKSTLAAALAAELTRKAAGAAVACISCDPGLPAFGPPGALTLAGWEGGSWACERISPICSLDAARFRLPLVQALGFLSADVDDRILLIDAPGIARGMAAAELLTAMVSGTAVDTVLALQPEGEAPATAAELAVAGAQTFLLTPAGSARPLRKAARLKLRTNAWNAFLADARLADLELDELRVVGAPPPAERFELWVGRQVALGGPESWAAFGEIVEAGPSGIRARLVGSVAGADRIMIRDAGRDGNGQLRTLVPVQPRRLPAVKQSSRRRLQVACDPLVAELVNGVTGDPLLLVRQRHRRGALLFDLGEAGALSRRALHTVTDVFLTHAHLDHIAGFPYLLRSRLSAPLPPLRIYGPPGTHEHIAGFLAGVHWDRIGDDGPAFEVHELDGERIDRYQLKAGHDLSRGPAAVAREGMLLSTPEYVVRALELDHGIPVLAYALELVARHNVNPVHLEEAGLEPGPWIGDLKAYVTRGDLTTLVELPDGRRVAAAELAKEFLTTFPGPRLVYATDFADTPENRARMQGFARNADLLFCEATFRNADVELARETQHLTTRACGEIGLAAAAHRLVPFHFSKRYEGRLEAVYEELRDAGGGVTMERHPAA